ncbi:MAG: CsgG/HfaB family protein [Rhodovibrionaceae bacterium]
MQRYRLSRLPGATRFLAPIVIGALLGGCASIGHNQVSGDEATLVMGPAVRDNSTPLETAYACYRDQLVENKVGVGIGVGDVRDYTGKISDFEGTVVTQGGSLMAYSALGKLSPSVRIHERFDTRVAELELAYSDNRRLGDGEVYQVDGRPVPWVPYFGGTILKSDYYIVGGITEVNYNIQSGGAQASFNLIGPRARVFTMNVGVDLRLVDTDSLMVVATSSLQKQIVGYEVEFEVFRFFDTTLVDFNAGMKNQEPVQLGVRTTIELAVLDLLNQATGQSYENCISDYFLGPEIPPFDPPGPAGDEDKSKAAAPVVQARAEEGVSEPEFEKNFLSTAAGEAGAAEGQQLSATSERTHEHTASDVSVFAWIEGLLRGANNEQDSAAALSLNSDLVADAPVAPAANPEISLTSESDAAMAWRELALAWRDLALAREEAGLGRHHNVEHELEVAALQWLPRD